jgi:dTDP-L-rhamnose 4-epimerase
VGPHASGPTRYRLPVRTTPGEWARISGEYRFGDTRHIWSDIDALKQLGWAPTRGPAESVAEYAAWLQGMPGLDDVLAEADAKMRALGVVRRAEG